MEETNNISCVMLQNPFVYYFHSNFSKRNMNTVGLMKAGVPIFVVAFVCQASVCCIRIIHFVVV